MIAYFAHVHLTSGDTKAAIRTFIFVNFYAYHSKFTEESVNCTERAEETAEKSKEENTANDKQHKQDKFPSE